MEHRWFFPLLGHEVDLEEIRFHLKTDDLRVEDQEGIPCLCGARFDALDDLREAYEAARGAVATLNTVFRAVSGPDFEPLSVDSIFFKTQPDGLRRHVVLGLGPMVSRNSFGKLIVTAAGTPPGSDGLTLAEKMVKAADTSAHFRSALRAFTAMPTNFPDLFVAFETIKQRGQIGQEARKLGGSHIVDQGWATEDEMRDFFETAQLYRHGQPPGPIKEGRNEMSLEAARHLISKLLFKWAEELAPDVP